MAENSNKCPSCGGRGYILCDCWPGDCICGFGDQTCEECEGHGDIRPDDDWYPGIECEHGYDACPDCDAQPITASKDQEEQSE